MTTINLNITASDDDVYELWSGETFYSVDTSEDTAYVGSVELISSTLYAGLRFQSVALPVGATITNATLTVYCNDIAGAPETTVYGNDIDDAPAWSASNYVKNITKTSASATKSSWTLSADNTIDVTDIVTEIAARAGWTSGNSMAFGLFDAVGAGDNHAGYATYDHTTQTEARLSITYTAAGGGGTRNFGSVMG